MALFHPLPDVFLLGAQRAGTTFLHAALEHHAGVRAAKRKELQFFTHHWHLGLPYLHAQMPRRWPRWIYRWTRTDRPLVIDSTPYYLFHPDVPKRVAATISDSAKYIVLLREPGARAWSHYQFMVKLGWENLGFLEALARETERTGMTQTFPDRHPFMTGHQIFSYAARGLYADQLCTWWRHIGRERFLLLRSEDLFREPQATFDRVCRFLNLSPMHLPSRLPHNGTSRSPMPAAARAQLDAFFEKPNRDLHELTGIGWSLRQKATASETREVICSP